MAIELFAHNQMTYQNLIKQFETKNRVACVQPTGTGKSFVILKLIEDNPSSLFIVASPSNYIFGQIEQYRKQFGIDHENIRYITYTKLTQMSADEISDLPCEYIILDEFHRCGAAEWGRGVNIMLETHNDAKVLGTSAPPIRYLDNCRNMAEEIFGNNYAANMSIGEALARKILPAPVYVASMYSFSGELDRLQKKAEATGDERLRLTVINKITKAKRMISEKGNGLEEIFKKHIPNKSGKYIVFCSNYERLEQAYEESKFWFADINSLLHRYVVTSANSDSRQEFEAFETDSSDALKLLFCVDMLNEGVHIDGVEGVIMLRLTVSTNVYYQQLGRALSCGDKDIKRPVIFDIVNNFESGQSELLRNELLQYIRSGSGHDCGDIEFTMFDYLVDIRNVLEDISRDLEQGWNYYFDLLRRFKTENNRFPRVLERYSETNIGYWCNNQRTAYKNKALSDMQVQKLESIGFIWDGNKQIWYEYFAALKDFVAENGRFPASDESHNGYDIGVWCAKIRTQYKAGKVDEQLVSELGTVGFIWDIDEKTWMEKYELLKAFINQHGRPPYPKEEMDGIRIGAWLTKQRHHIKNNSISVVRKRKLMGISVEVDNRTYEEKWEAYFQALDCFISENDRLPAASDKFDDINLYYWINTQKKRYKSGNLTDRQRKLLLSVGISLITVPSGERWGESYRKFGAFGLENGGLPMVPESHEGYPVGE